MRPRLTIAIPTWNRARVLEPALVGLFRARAGYSEQVEVIVSDNASPDDTGAVAQAWQYEPNFRYFRHPQNVGAVTNVLYIARNLAQGEFCWIVGDDDLIFPDAVRRVLDLIVTQPDLDVILLSHALDSVAVRDALAASGDVSNYRAPDNMPYPSLGSSARYTRLAELLERAGGSFEPFTHIGTQIFRPEKWRAHLVGAENFSVARPFESLDSTFPHLWLLLRSTTGPVYYCGDLLFLAGIGAQEWSGSGGWLRCALNAEAMPHWYKLAGVRAPYLKLMRRHWMNYWLMYRRELLALRHGGGPHADLFRRFFLRSLRHPWTFLRSATPLLLNDVYTRLPAPLQAAYRSLRRLTTGQTLPASARR